MLQRRLTPAKRVAQDRAATSAPARAGSLKHAQDFLHKLAHRLISRYDQIALRRPPHHEHGAEPASSKKHLGRFLGLPFGPPHEQSGRGWPCGVSYRPAQYIQDVSAVRTYLRGDFSLRPLDCLRLAGLSLDRDHNAAINIEPGRRSPRWDVSSPVGELPQSRAVVTAAECHRRPADSRRPRCLAAMTEQCSSRQRRIRQTEVLAQVALAIETLAVRHRQGSEPVRSINNCVSRE